MDKNQNKKVGQSIEELINAMEKSVNNGKEPNWWNKNKNTIKNIASGLGIGVFVIGGSIFTVCVFNAFVEMEHQRFRQEVLEEFNSALNARQQMSDTIAYNAQNSR